MPLLRLTFHLVSLFAGFLLCLSSQAQISETTSHVNHFLFEENKGQFDTNVLYRCELPTGFMFIEKDRITYLFEDQADRAELMRRFHNHQFIGPEQPLIHNSHAVQLNFVDKSSSSYLETSMPEGYYHNYFVGSKANWASDVRLYSEIAYRNMYPGIDLLIYTDSSGSLKFDWLVTDGANPALIKLQYSGADNLELLQETLIVHTSVGSFFESSPYLVQENEQLARSLPNCHYQLEDSVVSFNIENQEQLSGAYIIDPKLIFSTYSGSRGDNFGFTATYDLKGNLYAGGITNGSQGPYPVTSGAIQKVYGGGAAFAPANLPCDITISKYDSAGNNLLWATYLGGDLDEYPHSLVTDRDNDLLIFGTSYSENYPTTDDAYDQSFNGDVDIVVTKISEDGKTLLGSTYIGGSGVDGLNSNNALRYNYADDFRGDIIPDENKTVYVASCTESNDFPLIDAVDTSQKFQEGCILQLTPNLTDLEWATFLGGSGRDALYSIKVDSDSSVYVGGGTSSTDLIKSDSVLSNSYFGAVDGFVAKLDRKNHTLTKLTYWGTPSYDQVYFIDLDENGHIFLAGQTTGNIKPSPNVYGQANKGQFVAKLDTSLNNIVWQTSFGKRDNNIDISPSAFLVDNCEHIYVSGWGSNVRPDLNPGSTIDLETTSDAVQKTTDGNDFYIIVLNKDAESLLYATYFGGDSTGDHVDGGTSRFDKKGVIYQSVCSSCPNGGEPGHQDFPVTANAAFTTNFSPRCSNASFKIDLQIKSAVDAYFVPDPIIGCNPLDVDFENRSDIVEKFIWDFGDGSFDSTNLHPKHIYDKPGEYIITLTVIDSNTCNISDQFRRSVRVLGASDAQFTFDLNGCTNEVMFETESEGLNYLWVLGDGDSAYTRSFTHIYPPGGKYDVWFYVNPGTLCADSIKKTINTNDPGNRDLLIPNVFTPNSDGFNDLYCLDGFTKNCDEIVLRIYNRWGELVFKTKDIEECWDGSVLNRSRQHPPGTYFYILNVTYGDTGEKNTVSGTVTLIKE